MDDDGPLQPKPGPRRLRWILGLAVLAMTLLIAFGSGMAPEVPTYELALLCGGIAAAAAFGQLRRPRDPSDPTLWVARAIPTRARHQVDLAA